jgi:hypothetical protein
MWLLKTFKYLLYARASHAFLVLCHLLHHLLHLFAVSLNGDVLQADQQCIASKIKANDQHFDHAKP